jgi:ribosomal protein S12 methylthiotransferase
MTKIGLVSLGCAKNLIDSEMILAMFTGPDYAFTDDPSQADLIIVNTCGFIEPAKKEAIETILEMTAYPNAKLIVTGCFVERNLEELKKSLPEVLLWVPLKDYPKMHEIVGAFIGKNDIAPMDPLQRILSTPPYFAYLRISEGCDNFCSFCAIPYIRGRLRSRPIEEILAEARALKKHGVKEIALVSQDPMHYGKDFTLKKPDMLVLLKALEALSFYSVRLLYLYPDEITDEELTFIQTSKTIAHYFDIPIQSASDNVLSLMNRRGTQDSMGRLFRKIKALMPEAVLRTTLISGFPGETEKDQEETLRFLEEVRFDHLGDFAFSKEEGTAAYALPHQVETAVKEKRREEIMTLQRKISYEQNKKRVGEVMEGLVTGYDEKRKLYSLRSYWNAPDDIDGNIFFSSPAKIENGDIAKVKITSCFIYDLMGEKI